MKKPARHIWQRFFCLLGFHLMIWSWPRNPRKPIKAVCAVCGQRWRVKNGRYEKARR